MITFNIRIFLGILLTTAALAALIALTSCPVLKSGGDSGTASQSGSGAGASGTGASGVGAASGGEKSGVTTKPLEIPRKVLRSMDFPADFTLEEVDETREGVHIVYAANPPRTEEIAQLHISDLSTRGYTTDDNPSRILEGVEFTGGEWRSIYVKVTEEASRGTVVTIDIRY